MRGSTVALLLLLLSLARAPAAELCFHAPGGSHPVQCIDASSDGANVTFTAACFSVGPMGAPTETPAWCAFGLPLRGTGMAPAEVFFISTLKDGSVAVEDRFNAVHYETPACVRQVSHTLSASAEGGKITAKWTRPLALPAERGFVNITRGAPRPVIASWASDTVRPRKRCEMQWTEHNMMWRQNWTIA